MNKAPVDLKGRSLVTLLDFTPQELRRLLDLAARLKSRRRAGGAGALLAGKNILLLFEKTSSRTRCAFELGAAEEGAHVTYVGPGTSQFGKKESLEDSARLFGRFYDAIGFRGYGSCETVRDLARFSGVPVWNGLTDDDHPTQILSDLMTMEEHLQKPLAEAKLVFCGDTRNNMAYAWIYGCAKMGMRFVGYGPKELTPDPAVSARAAAAAAPGAEISFSDDAACLAGADVIYTDVWASMGEEDRIAEKARLLAPYKVTQELLARTGNDNVLFMHCLPAFHDFETSTAVACRDLGVDIREVEDAVFRGKHSVVFDEAENRLHTIKAVMVATLAEESAWADRVETASS
ncbi:MAG: ornithine carbamoyltransferase [Clostridiales Family XIII bacterium]|jgi:ornithine carbamoyltransferase|nr:ornithine carbamoyltransferase [Clostridiales Family XIII bacterium]